jgi:hypothetical protein
MAGLEPVLVNGGRTPLSRQFSPVERDLSIFESQKTESPVAPACVPASSYAGQNDRPDCHGETNSQASQWLKAWVWLPAWVWYDFPHLKEPVVFFLLNVVAFRNGRLESLSHAATEKILRKPHDTKTFPPSP